MTRKTAKKTMPSGRNHVMHLRSLYIPALLGVLCSGAETAHARRTPVTIQPGTYRLSYDTNDQRWDSHTLASSGHRGALTLTIKRAAATLTLKERWTYRSSSDHGVSGGPVRLLFRNIGYHYTWRGRIRSTKGGVDIALAVTAATCTAFPRRGRGAGRGYTCEERPPLRLVCKPGGERVHRAAKADAEDPSLIKRGETARSVQTLRCASPAPLPRLLAHMTHKKTIPLTRGAPLQLYKNKTSDGKTKAALRRR